MRVRLSAKAERDADVIFDWIATRSKDGAGRWYDAYTLTIQSLASVGKSAILAPEADDLGIDLHQVLFKTRKGRSYRCLFFILEDTIDVVAIRGAGQDIATLDDLGSVD